MKYKSVFYLLIFICLCCSSRAKAHPHVWIDCKLEIIFDKQGLAGFKQCWTFDEMFSQMILADIDLDKDRHINGQENQQVKQTAFANLVNFGYFTDIRINSQKFKVKYIKNFKCKIHGMQMIYEFEIPCHVRAADSFKEIIIGIYDKSYYTDIIYTAETPIITAANSFITDYEFIKLDDSPFEVIFFYPQAIKLKFKK